MLVQTYAKNTERIHSVNTRCINTSGIERRMSDDDLIDGPDVRLRKARTDAGYESAKAAAEAFGWGVSTYTHHENGTRGFAPPEAVKYGSAFRVAPGWLLGLDLLGARQTSAFTPSYSQRLLPFLGLAAQGHWIESGLDDTQQPEMIPVDTMVDDGGEMFVIQPVGDSMNLTVPKGALLICRRVPWDLDHVEIGDLVVVERCQHDRRERTVKRLVKIDGNLALQPESDRPEFQDTILVGSPSEDHHQDDEIRIVGVVLRAVVDMRRGRVFN